MDLGEWERISLPVSVAFLSDTCFEVANVSRALCNLNCIYVQFNAAEATKATLIFLNRHF